ncbi:Protein of unknown function [Gryllus bimaculatus]|nr:Protein of unknown function [Gryllus bimaculatus]
MDGWEDIRLKAVSQEQQQQHFHEILQFLFHLSWSGFALFEEMLEPTSPQYHNEEPCISADFEVAGEPADEDSDMFLSLRAVLPDATDLFFPGLVLGGVLLTRFFSAAEVPSEEDFSCDDELFRATPGADISLMPDKSLNSLFGVNLLTFKRVFADFLGVVFTDFLPPDFCTTRSLDNNLKFNGESFNEDIFVLVGVGFSNESLGVVFPTYNSFSLTGVPLLLDDLPSLIAASLPAETLMSLTKTILGKVSLGVTAFGWGVCFLFGVEDFRPIFGDFLSGDGMFLGEAAFSWGVGLPLGEAAFCWGVALPLGEAAFLLGHCFAVGILSSLQYKRTQAPRIPQNKILWGIEPPNLSNVQWMSEKKRTLCAPCSHADLKHFNLFPLTQRLDTKNAWQHQGLDVITCPSRLFEVLEPS